MDPQGNDNPRYNKLNTLNSWEFIMRHTPHGSLVPWNVWLTVCETCNLGKSFGCTAILKSETSICHLKSPYAYFKWNRLCWSCPELTQKSNNNRYEHLRMTGWIHESDISKWSGSWCGISIRKIPYLGKCRDLARRKYINMSTKNLDGLARRLSFQCKCLDSWHGTVYTLWYILPTLRLLE